MRAAVLIVNYRTYDALARCLDSLVPHLRADDEVVVVDWMTADGAREALAVRFPRVRWIARPDNRGFAAGVNLAARATTAPCLVLLNPDSIVAGPLLDRLTLWMRDHTDVGVAGPRVCNSDGTLQASARRFPGVSTAFGGRSTWLTRRFPSNWLTRRNLLTTGDGAVARDVDWVAGSCFATRRETFDALDGLDEGFFMYWEDADYCRRAVAAGWRCVYVPVVDVRHTGGVSSAQAVAPSIRAFHRSAFRLFWKHSRVGRLWAPVVWLALTARAEIKVMLASTRPQRSAVL